MGQVDLGRYSNNNYVPGGFAKRILWYIFSRVFFKTFFPFPSGLKLFLLNLFGARIGKSVIIKVNVNIKYPWFLEIGNNTWIGEGSWIDNLVKVKIGNNVCISQGVCIFTGNHNYKKETFDLIVSQVIIEDGSWLGAKSIICPGVNVKSHCVITVGSVLTNDTEAYKIYQGNPAKIIRDRVIEK